MDTSVVVTIIIAAIGFVGSLIVSAIAIGVSKQKLDEAAKRNDSQDSVIDKLATKVELQGLEIRLKEDRERNDKRIEELYNSRNEHAKVMERIGEQMKGLADALAELKKDFKDGLKDLREDIKKAGCA